MEFEENNPAQAQEEEAVEIYSKRAVFWFSFLLGPIFGSVLLMLNLKEVGYKRAVNAILLFTVLIDVISQTIVFLYINYAKIDVVAIQEKLMKYKQGDAYPLDDKYLLMLLIALIVRLSGALIISQYFFKKYFPEDDYYARSIANVLPLCILVWIILQFIGLAI